MKVAALPEFGGPQVFTITDVPAPVPQPEEVVIHVVAAGVNRADILQRQGHYPPPQGTVQWPGLEVSGVIEEVGSRVTTWQPGMDVCALLAGGGYAERVAVHQDLLLPVPSGLTMVEAAGMVETACTVWSNLEAADAARGQTLLVHGGSGGVGTTAIQVGRALGMTVVATAGGQERAQRCIDLGAHHAIDYRSEDFASIVEGLGGADVVLDTVGAAYMERNLTALNPDGTLVIIGLQGGATASLNLAALLAKRQRVVGTTLRSRPHAQKAAIVRSVVENVWPLIPVDVRPLIHATFALDEVALAHSALESGEVFGKVVLLVDGGAL